MGTEEVVNTTNFHNDAGMRQATISNPLDLSPTFYKDPESLEGTSLAFYLGRPIILQQGQLDINDTATTFTALAMPQYMLTKAIYADKPRGRLGFRATMVFRLVVNAERFHQGRYMLTYCPLGGSRYGTSQKGNAWVNKHSATLRQRSQLPKVEFDLNCDSEVTLRVPYASVYDFYQFSWANGATGIGSWGVLRLFPYSNLALSGGSSNCDYTIYGHFEDIEFVGFSDTQITAQSGNPFASTVTKRSSITANEAKRNGVGPIQSMATSVAKAARYLAPVPVLTNFAGSAAWAADIIANVASVFGWSAPLNVEKASRMMITNYAYYGNANKVDNSLPLALTTDNEVVVAPGFSSTNDDELDLVRMASIPAYWAAVPWATSYIVGYELATYTISPNTFFSTATYQTQTYASFTPLAYVAKFFNEWRGSIVFKIKVVKTEFHSGRLAFAYYPPGYTARNLTSSDYVHRDVIDIRMHSEITLTVPYSAPTSYISKSNPSASDNGQLSIFVLDRLVAPSNVSSTITLLIEVAGGPDIEFAVPVTSLPATSAVDYTVQSADPFSVNSDCAIVNKPIGVASVPTYQLDTSQICIGERITSFRQLLKRYSNIYKATWESTSAFLRILPYANVTTATSGGTDTVPIYGDLYSELSNIFMFSRGGVRFKVFDNIASGPTTGITTLSSAANFNNATVAMNLGSTSSATNTVTPLALLVNNSQYVISDLERNKAIEVAVPQYHFNKSRNNSEQVVTVGSAASTAYTSDLVLCCSLSSDLTSTTVPWVAPYVFRSGADDCNFGLFISIPPMCYNPST